VENGERGSLWSESILGLKIHSDVWADKSLSITARRGGKDGFLGLCGGIVQSSVFPLHQPPFISVFPM